MRDGNREGRPGRVPLVFAVSSTQSRPPGGGTPTKRRGARRSRILWALAAVLAPVVTVVALWPAVLFRVATPLIVVDDPPVAADFIYVLNGQIDQRARLAARLYLDGLAPRVLLPHTREVVAGRRGNPATTLSERIASEITAQGVPASSVVVVPFRGGVVNTRDEAKALRSHLEREPARRVILVTTDYHTGRAGRTVRQELRGLDVEVLVAGAPDEHGVTPATWWQTEQGRQLYYGELLRQAAVIVQGLIP